MQIGVSIHRYFLCFFFGSFFYVHFVLFRLFSFYLILFLFLDSYLCFNEREREGVDLGWWGGGGGAGGRETIMGIYCMKNNIFNFKKKKKCSL